MKNFLILGAIASLTACGTTTNPPPPTALPGVSKNMTAVITGDDIAAIGASSPVAISIGGTPLTNLTRQSALDNVPNGLFAAAVATVNINDIYEVAFTGTTVSGGASAALAGENTGTGGVTYARVGQTTLPTSGTGSFSGDYVGYFLGSVTGDMSAIHGDVLLNIGNWGSPTISGAITNRVVILGDGTSPVSDGTFAQVTLNDTAVSSNGLYSGSTSGGKRAGVLTVVDISGAYQGLIGGANGTQTAGGVKIVKTYNGNSYTEFGAFLAE